MTGSLVPTLVPSLALPSRPDTPRSPRTGPRRQLPVARLVSARERTTVYGLTAVDGRGRVTDRTVTHALGWQPGNPLSIRVTNGLIIVAAGPGCPSPRSATMQMCDDRSRHEPPAAARGRRQSAPPRGPTTAAGGELTVSAIARQAGVDRSYLYRHPDLLERLHLAQETPPNGTGGPIVSRASVKAGLLGSQARTDRLQARGSTRWRSASQSHSAHRYGMSQGSGQPQTWTPSNAATPTSNSALSN
jgi:hypothetical protein